MKNMWIGAWALALVLTMTGCGSDGNADKGAVEDAVPGVAVKSESGVDARNGGPGFEEFAEELGFQTYEPAPEQLRFSGDPQAKTGGEFRFIIPRFPLTFRPLGYGQNARYAENYYFNELIYEPLLGINHVTMDFQPRLATHWKISADRSTYSFRLDPNARFSTGEPVTAQDVIATWQLLSNSDIKMPEITEKFSKFEEPVAVSPFLVEVTTMERKWDSFLSFASQMIILPASAISQLSGTEFLTNFDFDMVPGTGEYIIYPEDIEKQKSYVLKRRDDYWRKDYPSQRFQGNFDRIRFEVVKDNENLEYEKFKKGEQDMFYYTSATMEQWVNDNDYSAMQKGWVLKKRLHTDGPSSQWGIAINMRRAPFDDLNVRKAVCHLFNREAFIKKALYNEYKPLDSFFGNSAYENPNNPRVRFNPTLAAELLAEAGWKEKNSDGILVKNGQPFVITFGISKSVERFVTPFQAEMRRVGIDLQIKFEDQNTNFEKAMERNFTFFWSTLSGSVFPDPRTTVHSEFADKKHTWNMSGMKHPRIDAIIDEYDTTYTQPRREVLLQELDSLRMETYSRILLYEPQGIKISVWNKFGIPDFHFERVARAGDFVVSIFKYWWYSEEKAQQLETAMKSDAVIQPYSGVEDIWFWKEYGKTAAL